MIEWIIGGAIAAAIFGSPSKNSKSVKSVKNQSDNEKAAIVGLDSNVVNKYNKYIKNNSRTFTGFVKYTNGELLLKDYSKVFIIIHAKYINANKDNSVQISPMRLFADYIVYLATKRDGYGILLKGLYKSVDDLLGCKQRAPQEYLKLYKDFIHHLALVTSNEDIGRSVQIGFNVIFGEMEILRKNGQKDLCFKKYYKMIENI